MNYVIYKTEDKRWVFEESVNGEIIKHFYTAKRRAVNGVLRLNPGDKTIIICFQEGR